MDVETLRKHAVDIFKSCLKAVDPYKAVKRVLTVKGNLMVVKDNGGVEHEINLGKYNRIFVVGGGKATAPMAKAVEDVLGERITEGFINVKYGFGLPLRYIEVWEAGHPLPDQNGLEGTKKIVEILRQAGEGDLVISLISGGGSALLPLPANGITLEEKQHVTEMLLECGASIDEINTVRKHISVSKGGQMARAAYPASTINLMLSDVVGDRLDVIASGPFVPDASTFMDAQKIFKKYDLRDLPPKVISYIRDGIDGRVPETPKEGDPIFNNVFNIVVGSNIKALMAARQRAVELGYQTVILSSMIEGETRDVARVHAAIAKEILRTGNPLKPPVCVISGGETTVTVRGKGKGGRNQEFCLAAAIEISELPSRVVMLSGGTDGNDGPTDAAGGIVDPDTIKRAGYKGLNPLSFLQNNDAYNFLKATGDLLITGPTKTNVMDIHLIIVR